MAAVAAACLVAVWVVWGASTRRSIPQVVAVASTGGGGGLVLHADGAVTALGQAAAAGGVRTEPGHTPAAISPTPGGGYLVVTRQGQVSTFGSAHWFGSAPASGADPVVAAATSAAGRGYWLLLREGRILAFGAAHRLGSPVTGAGDPAVSLTSTADGLGYYVLTASGRVFAFGDARLLPGAVGSVHEPAVGLEITPSGDGYWLLEADGSVRGFGRAMVGEGTAGLEHPVGLVGATRSSYDVVGASGTVTAYGVPSPTPWLGSTMRLIFDDEFSGTRLRNTWDTCWWYSPGGCSNGDGEGEWYLPANVTVSDGALDLTARDTPTAGRVMTSGAPRTYRWTSGMVTTHGAFNFTYGYVEWRAELPEGQGLWPALWLMPADNSWPPEIDAVETLGNQPDIGNFTYHEPSGAADGYAVRLAGLSQQWHTFGVDWEPGRITWYVDGRQVATTTANITDRAMYLVMDLAVGGAWPGYPDSSTRFPATLSIADVRVWQHD